MLVKIYKLIHPTTKEIRYVGKTVQSLKKRLSGHITASKKEGKKNHCQSWIYSLLSQNLKPEIILIEECNTNIWEEREKYWIKYHKNLTNLHEGGNSASGHKLSDEHKQNVSSALRGKKRPDEVKQKISAWHKGKVLSQSTKDKLRQCNLGKNQSLEQRLKTSYGGILQIDPLTNKIVKEYLTLGDIIKENPKLYKGNIASACNGRLKTYQKFIWKYKKDMV
jgi:hypothetical protein